MAKLKLGADTVRLKSKPVRYTTVKWGRSGKAKQMGFLDRLFKTPKTAETAISASTGKKPIVRVSYIDWDEERFDPSWVARKIQEGGYRGYSYYWPSSIEPTLGQCAQDPDGKNVIVVGFGRDPNYRGGLKTLHFVSEVNVFAQAASYESKRIAEAKRALAGEDIDGVPPAQTNGGVDADTAGEYGTWWWRTAKAAEAAGDPAARKIKSVANFWYKIRDAG